jgi:lysyl-tRNA synthetase class 1
MSSSSLSTSSSSTSSSTDWVARAADDALAAHARRPGPPGPLVCASGVSPSGPVHLGHLRELLTPHLVAEEIRRRGVPCEHLLFWDDYDRLRKIPKGVPAGFDDHLGRPLCDVPDPFGEYPSWAERFAAPVRAAVAELGVPVREISQARRYRSGVYTAQVVRAIAARDGIHRVLATYRTAGPTGDEPYYPYRVYCAVCGRDTTAITGYDDASTELAYRCASCGHRDAHRLADGAGKLVWKVDWPMRWAFEPVTFESAGADHASPGSSVTVGQRLCRDVFGAEPPVFVGFSFVGVRGTAKLSSSAGAVPTPGDALAVLEAPVLRWLYARRRPQQSITIDLGPDLTRLYDEWDRLAGRAATADPATPAEPAGTTRGELVAYRRAACTSDAGWLPRPAVTVAWRLLTSAVDITAGDDGQLLRVLRDAGTGVTELAQVEPRLCKARQWVAGLPADERTRVRDEPATNLLAGLTGDDRAGLELLLAGLAERWSLAGLTALVYGVPKRLRGLAEDAPADTGLKRAQREFFTLLYRLLVDADTGPRLPTLLLALGPDRLRRLLTVPPVPSVRPAAVR